MYLLDARVKKFLIAQNIFLLQENIIALLESIFGIQRKFFIASKIKLFLMINMFFV